MPITDSFSGPSGEALLNRQLDTGQRWSAAVGDWFISSNRAQQTTTSDVLQNWLVVETGQSDVDVSADIVIPAAGSGHVQVGVTVQHASANDYFWAQYSGNLNRLILIEKSAGTQATRIFHNFGSTIYGSTRLLRVVASGVNIKVYDNGTLYLDYNRITPILAPQTRHGLWNQQAQGNALTYHDNFALSNPAMTLRTGTFVTLDLSPPQIIFTAEVGAPAPASEVTAAFAPLTLTPPQIIFTGGRGDPSKNTLFSFWLARPESHTLVTEAGEWLRFIANFDITLGGIREGMLGLSGDAWYPESGLTGRTPAALQLSCYLPNRDDPQADGDRLKRLLPDVRTLVLPDGQVWPLHYGALRARPNPETLELTLYPTRQEPQTLLERATLTATFETEGSSPEAPIFAVDTAGAIETALEPGAGNLGTLLFAVRLTDDAPLCSIGEPGEPGYIGLEYRRDALWLSLRGKSARIRARDLGLYGAPLVLGLHWTNTRAELLTISTAGRRTWPLAIGAPGAHTPVLRGGRGVVQAFMGSGVAWYTPRTLKAAALAEVAEKFYTRLTAPGLSWVIKPPDFSLSVARTVTRSLAVAPGETVTADYVVTREGGYDGALEVAVSSSSGLVTSINPVAGQPDTHRVTLTAPAATPEGVETLRLEVNASGANVPGSLLVSVRTALDEVVEVAGSPVIAPNATFVLRAFDPVQKRDSEMLRDSSSNANTFSWSGLARPDREFKGILMTGGFDAAVTSGTLANAAQAQRMNANATLCLILAESSKTAEGGVVVELTGATGDALRVIKAAGGFKIQTARAGSTVTSPETLAHSSGFARPVLTISDALVTLYNRDSGQSVSVSRPAWADSAVRVAFGANRSSTGALSNLTRVHLMAASLHPYALSDLARRRNMDMLESYAPALDGKGEFPDNAYIIALWETALGTYRNLAAPALSIALTPVGAVTTIPGGIQTTGADDSHVFANTGIPSSQVVTLLTTILDFASPTAYTAHIALNDSVAVGGKATLTRHGGGQAFPQSGNTDLTSAYSGTVGDKVPPGKASFKLRVHDNGRKNECTELRGGNKRTTQGNATWTGNMVLSIGRVNRANGAFTDRCATKQLGTVLVRGEMSADDTVTSQKLLEA